MNENNRLYKNLANESLAFTASSMVLGILKYKNELLNSMERSNEMIAILQLFFTASFDGCPNSQRTLQ